MLHTLEFYSSIKLYIVATFSVATCHRREKPTKTKNVFKIKETVAPQKNRKTGARRKIAYNTR